MKRYETEQTIKQAFERVTPNVLDRVISDCSTQKGMIVTMKTTNNRKWVSRVIGIAAAFVVLAVGIVTAPLLFSDKVDSRISLDVNPSVEIETDKDDRVIQVTALNRDGETIIGNMEFAGNSLELTVNALVGSMLRNGYLDELSNSILVSVDNKDEKKSAELQQKLSTQIDEMLRSDAFDGAVLSQSVSEDKELRKLAETYGITVGKAKLIRELVVGNPLYTYEALAPLSINELNLLSQSKRQPLTEIHSVGNASEKAYIGKDKAKEIAAKHIGVSIDQLNRYECEMDYERGTMIYELEFVYNEYEYDFEIHATTGEIVDFDKERAEKVNVTVNTSTTTGNIGSIPTTTTTSVSTAISADKAKEIAFKHAKVDESDVWAYRCELDVDDGVAHWEIEFSSGKYDYEYGIHAETGKVLKADTDFEDDQPKSTSSTKKNTTTKKDTTTTTVSYIGKDKAKEIALTHAGVSADDIRGFECELDDDDRVMVYEIEFSCNGYEYDYEINAQSGAIRRSDKEIDD